MSQESSLCNVIAFYGMDPSRFANGAWYDTVLGWFEANDCHPARLGVHGDGFSGKLLRFSPSNSRLKKAGFSGIESIEVHSDAPAETLGASDGMLTADVSLRNAYAVLAADSSLVSFEGMLDIAEAIARDLRPCYGIGYKRERRLGPVFYAIGINYGVSDVFAGPEYEEKVRISSWSDGMDQQVYRDGVVRGIYPYNFLTELQLSRPVGDGVLREWIGGDATRGKLHRFARDMSLWTVPENALAEMHDVLERNGVIYRP